MLRFGEEVVVERVGAAVLLDEEDLGGALDDVDEFGDDGVVEFGEDVDFPFKILNLVGLVEALLFVDLDGYFLVGAFADAHLDDPVGSLAQFLVDLVVLHLLLGLEFLLAVEELLADGLALLLLLHLLQLLHLLLLLLLHLLDLQLVYVVGGELLLHQRVHQFLVLDACALLLLLQGLLAALRVRHSLRLVPARGDQFEVLIRVRGGVGGLAHAAQVHHAHVFLLLVLLGGVVAAGGDFEALAFAFGGLY